MHWNILAQRLAESFDKIPNDSPILYYKNRLSLFKQHFEALDPDIIGLSEVDAISGDNIETLLELLKIMKNLGYAHYYHEKSNHMTASAIFYKADKFNLLISHQFPYSPGES